MSNELSPLGNQPHAPALSDLNSTMVSESVRSLNSSEAAINAVGSLEVFDDRLLCCQIPDESGLETETLRVFEFSLWGEYRGFTDISLHAYPKRIVYFHRWNRLLGFSASSDYWIVEDDFQSTHGAAAFAVQSLYDHDGHKQLELLTDKQGLANDLQWPDRILDLSDGVGSYFVVGQYIVRVSPTEVKLGDRRFDYKSEYHRLKIWDISTRQDAYMSESWEEKAAAEPVLYPREYEVRFPVAWMFDCYHSPDGEEYCSWLESWSVTHTTASAIWFIEDALATIWKLTVEPDRQGEVGVYKLPSVGDVLSSAEFRSIVENGASLDWGSAEAHWTGELRVSEPYIATLLTSNHGEFIVVLAIEEGELNLHRVFATRHFCDRFQYMEGTTGEVLFVTDSSGDVVRLNMENGSIVPLDLRVPEELVIS